MGQLRQYTALSFALVFCLATTPFEKGWADSGQGWHELELSVVNVPFGRDGRLGRAQHPDLRFEGGLSLDASHEMFGGFSGLDISQDGSRVIAISDEGWLLSVRLETEGQLLTGASDARLAPLVGIDGRPFASKWDSDAEAVTFSQDRRHAYVGFERNIRIKRYEISEDGLFINPSLIDIPALMQNAPRNRAIEALVKLHNGPMAGGLLAFLEKPLEEAIGNPQGWLLREGEEPVAFAIPLTEPYAITGAAEDSEGRIYLLERHFFPLTGPQIRIRRFIAEELVAGYGAGELILEAGMEDFIDNFEGIGVHQTQGRIYLTIISDDNFNLLQRNLLYRFSLPR